MQDKARMTFRFDKTGNKHADGGRTAEARAGAKIVPIRKQDEAIGQTQAGAPAPIDDVSSLERLIRETDRDYHERTTGGHEWSRLAVRSETDGLRVQAGARRGNDEYAGPTPGLPTQTVEPDRDMLAERLRLRTDEEPDRPDDKIWLSLPDHRTSGRETYARLEEWQQDDDDRDVRHFDPIDRTADRPAEPVRYTSAFSGSASGTSPRTGGPSWGKVLASLAGALATGALFGYVVLTLFAGQPPIPGLTGGGSGGAAKQTQTGDGSAAQTAQGSTAGQTKIGSGAAPAAGAGAQSAVIQPRTFYLLQYGVFTARKGMDAAAEELRALGLAAAVDESDGYRVYAGAAADLDGAHRLAGQLGGLQVFAKETRLPERISAPAASKETVRQFVEETDNLIAQLSGLTANKLAGTDVSPLSAQESEEWAAAHQQWTRKAAAVRQSLPAGEPARAAADRLAKAVDTAAASLGEYARKPAKAHLWSAQSALTEAVLLLKSWS